MKAQRVKNLKQKLSDTWAQVKAEGKSAYDEAFAEFFAAVPEVDSIVWTQYTPYWQDGDICEFGVNDFAFFLTQESYDLFASEESVRYTPQEWLEEDPYGEADASDLRGSKLPRAKEIIDLFDELTENIKNYEMLELIYGDHAAIIVNRTGTQIDEFNHS